MTLFWTIAAGLIVLAMTFVVLPLLRRHVGTGISSDELNLTVFRQQLEELDNDLKSGILDQERYDAAKIDLEKELLSDVSDNQAKEESAVSNKGRWMVLASLAVPLVAVLLYQMLGSPGIIQRLKEQPMAAATSSRGHAGNGSMQNLPPMDELVRRLAAKMKENPDNLEGWIMLGRSYMAMKQYPEAMDAYEHAMKLDGENVNLLLAYGEAIGTVSGNNFTGKSAPLIEKAYKLEPENPNALWMSGILSYQKGEYQTALTRWEKLQGILTPQSNELETVTSAIDDVRSKLGLAPVQAPLPSIAKANQQLRSAEPASAGGKSVQVKVTLSPALKDKASPNDLVFIYAKALSGPPMPLAAARKRVSDLPLMLTLDDSMAMMPQMRISAFPKVKIGARVSLSGSPTAQSGDLEGEVTPVTPGQSEQVSIVIDTVHP